MEVPLLSYKNKYNAIRLQWKSHWYDLILNGFLSFHVPVFQINFNSLYIYLIVTQSGINFVRIKFKYVKTVCSDVCFRSKCKKSYPTEECIKRKMHSMQLIMILSFTGVFFFFNLNLKICLAIIFSFRSQINEGL